MCALCVHTPGGSQYGIRTEDRRNIMTSKENLRTMAAGVIDSKKLRFLSNLVCVCDTDRVDADAAMKRLVDQLERYGADVLPPLRLGTLAVFCLRRGGKRVRSDADGASFHLRRSASPQVAWQARWSAR